MKITVWWVQTKQGLRCMYEAEFTSSLPYQWKDVLDKIRRIHVLTREHGRRKESKKKVLIISFLLLLPCTSVIWGEVLSWTFFQIFYILRIDLAWYENLFGNQIYLGLTRLSRFTYTSIFIHASIYSENDFFTTRISAGVVAYSQTYTMYPIHHCKTAGLL